MTIEFLNDKIKYARNKIQMKITIKLYESAKPSNNLEETNRVGKKKRKKGKPLEGDLLEAEKAAHLLSLLLPLKLKLSITYLNPSLPDPFLTQF